MSARVEYNKYKPPETFYYVALLGTTAPKSVKVGDVALPSKTGESDQAASIALTECDVDAYYHNGAIDITYIKIFDKRNDITIDATF